MIENQKKRNEDELKELKVNLERDKSEIQELRTMKVEAETKQQTAITELNQERREKMRIQNELSRYQEE